MIEAGEKAPAFTLQNQDGEPVSLDDYRGRTVVLYFYPAADTPGVHHAGVRHPRPQRRVRRRPAPR